MPGAEEITVRKSATTDVSLVQTPGHRAVLCAISTTNSRALCQVEHTWKALAASSTKKRFWLKESVSSRQNVKYPHRPKCLNAWFSASLLGKALEALGEEGWLLEAGDLATGL